MSSLERLAPLSDAHEDAPLVAAKHWAQTTIRATQAHAHKSGQLFGASRGLLSVGTQTGLWVVPAIHAVWIPPDHVHSVRSHGPFEGWSAYVAPRACVSLPAQPCTLRVTGLLREALARAAGWTHDELQLHEVRLAQVIVDEIATAPRAHFDLPMPRDARALRIARELATHPEDERTLQAWAQWGAMSARTLTRKFAEETGYAFGAWRQRARVMRAVERLAAGEPVTTVALDLGYGNVSAFIAMFKRTLGVTPGRFFEGDEGGA